MDSLTAYAKAFDFVEVNSTFYTIPSIEMVRSWRRRVPDNFVFSVRCHRDLTHKYMLSPCRASHEILHIQTPPSFNSDEKLKGIRDLFSSFDFGSIMPAWEIRGRITKGTIELMRDLGIIHCTIS